MTDTANSRRLLSAARVVSERGLLLGIAGSWAGDFFSAMTGSVKLGIYIKLVAGLILGMSLLSYCLWSLAHGERRSIRRVFVLLAAVSVALAALGLAGYSGNGEYYASAAIDFSTAIIYLSAAILAGFSKRSWDGLFWLYGLFVVLCVIFTAGKMSLGLVAAAQDRSFAYLGIGTIEAYKFQMSLFGAAPFFGAVAVVIGGRIKIGVSAGSLFLFLFYGLYYSKRNAIIELLSFIVLFLLPYSLSRGGHRFRSISIGAGLGALVLLLALDIGMGARVSTGENLLWRVIDRFENPLEEYAGVDRVDEARIMLGHLTEWQYVMGTGFGSIEPWLPLSDKNVHIGYANYVFKGGVILLGVMVLLFGRSLASSLRAAHVEVKVLGCFFTLHAMLMLSYSPGWGWYPTVLMFGCALFASEMAANIVGLRNAGKRQRGSGLTTEQRLGASISK